MNDSYGNFSRSMSILQARILEWVAFPFSRGSSQPRDQTQVSHIAGRIFTVWATREAHVTDSVSSVQSLSHVQLFVTPWTAAHQASLSITNSGVYSNSCPLSRWCHPTISSSVIPFSSCLQSFPGSGSFQMSQFFSSGDQTIGVSASASVLPMNIHDWFLKRNSPRWILAQVVWLACNRGKEEIAVDFFLSY